MISALFAIALMGPQSVPEQCSVIIPHPSGSGFTHQPAPGYSVANATPPLRLPEGFENVQMLACARQDLVITDNDFRIVLEHEVPVMIAGAGVRGTLELVEGRFRFRVTGGALTPAQQGLVDAALDRGQRLADRAATD